MPPLPCPSRQSTNGICIRRQLCKAVSTAFFLAHTTASCVISYGGCVSLQGERVDDLTGMETTENSAMGASRAWDRIISWHYKSRK